MDARTNLIAKIKAQGLPSADRPLPIVSLEDFFTGNNEYGSIGCNLADHPGPQLFFKVLKEIRARSTVQVLGTVSGREERRTLRNVAAQSCAAPEIPAAVAEPLGFLLQRHPDVNRAIAIYPFQPARGGCEVMLARVAYPAMPAFAPTRAVFLCRQWDRSSCDGRLRVSLYTVIIDTTARPA